MSKSIHRCCCLRVKVHLWNSSPSGIVMKLALSSWQGEGGMGAAVSPINWLVFGLKMSRPQVVENLRRALEDLLRNLGMVEFSRVQEGWLGAALCGTSVGRSVRRTHQQVTWARSLLQPMCSNSDSIAWHLKTFVTPVYPHLSAQNIWPDQPGWIFPDAGGRIKDGQSSASASARRVSPPEQWAAGQFVVGWAPSSAQWATR